MSLFNWMDPCSKARTDRLEAAVDKFAEGNDKYIKQIRDMEGDIVRLKEALKERPLVDVEKQLFEEKEHNVRMQERIRQREEAHVQMWEENQRLRAENAKLMMKSGQYDSLKLMVKDFMS